MDAKQRTYVETLMDKALKTEDAIQAVHFTQAACNAANVSRILAELDQKLPEGTPT